MAIDLHIHSTASDGNIDPAGTVRMAAAAGLKLIALADHETTAGFYPAYQEAKQLGVTIVPAVELLTVYKNHEVHLLGYFNKDPDHPFLQERLAELRQKRIECAKAAVQVLHKYGFQVPWEEVEAIAGHDVAVSIGHILRALRGRGYIQNRSDAMKFLEQYLKQGGLAHFSPGFSFDEGVALIKETEGLPILAHPGLIRNDEVVEELCAKGIAGLEVFYFYFGSSREEWNCRYQAMAEEKRLLKTGGSDYHGTVTTVKLGEQKVPAEGVGEFLNLLGIERF